MPKVLFADGDALCRTMYREMYRHHGWDCLAAGSASELLELARVAEPQVITVEWDLPPSGTEPVALQLREDPRTADIPLVILTGFIGPTVEARFELVRPDLVLAKPIRLNDLLEGLLSVLAVSVRSAFDDSMPASLIGELEHALNGTSSASATKHFAVVPGTNGHASPLNGNGHHHRHGHDHSKQGNGTFPTGRIIDAGWVAGPG